VTQTPTSASSSPASSRRRCTRKGSRKPCDSSPTVCGHGESAQAGLYQIVREALDQAIRRGPPTWIGVELRHTPAGGAELVISDDGSGERRQAVLDGLSERASTLNGELAVEQGPGGGTTVRVTVPPSAAQR
jgi:signal transduction histidine kinase